MTDDIEPGVDAKTGLDANSSEPSAPGDRPVTPAAAKKAYLAALERELEGYVRYDKPDRAKAVKAEIARVKGEADKGDDDDPETTTAEPAIETPEPKRRKGK